MQRKYKVEDSESDLSEEERYIDLWASEEDEVLSGDSENPNYETGEDGNGDDEGNEGDEKGKAGDEEREEQDDDEDERGDASPAKPASDQSRHHLVQT